MSQSAYYTYGGQTPNLSKRESSGNVHDSQFADSLLFSSNAQRRSSHAGNSPADFSSFSAFNNTRSGFGGATNYSVAGGTTGSGGAAGGSGGATVGQLALVPASDAAGREAAWLGGGGRAEAEPLLDDSLALGLGAGGGGPAAAAARGGGGDRGEGAGPGQLRFAAAAAGVDLGLGLRGRGGGAAEPGGGGEGGGGEGGGGGGGGGGDEEEEDDAAPPPTRSLLDPGATLSHTRGRPDSLAARPGGGTGDPEEARLRAAAARGGGGGGVDLARTALEAERWGRWVVAFGLEDAGARRAALAELRACGRVVEVAPRDEGRRRGNWLFARFETRLQAEKAVCRSGALLTPGRMMGVCRLDDRLAAKLNFSLDADGKGHLTSSDFAKQGGTEQIMKRKREYLSEDDSDILLERKRRDSACSRIMRWVLNMGSSAAPRLKES